jgi:hypothetical protein
MRPNLSRKNSSLTNRGSDVINCSWSSIHLHNGCLPEKCEKIKYAYYTKRNFYFYFVQKTQIFIWTKLKHCAQFFGLMAVLVPLFLKKLDFSRF